MAGRALFGMLSLPALDFRRDTVMEWLTSGPIVESWEGEHRGTLGAGPTLGRDLARRRRS